MKTFDVYAHHPYADKGSEAPGYKPAGAEARRIQLGNIGTLITQLTKLYGPKHLWITEYGYQTNPPDRQYGVSLALQAQYMKQAWAKLAANPRVDMMIWFLLRDEARVDAGWQSGLYTVGGARKPSRETFERLGL